jgi:hypothetical protein
MDYSLEGGTVILQWRNLNGTFDSIHIRVNERLSQSLEGHLEGVNLGHLPLGMYRLAVEGRKAERSFLASTQLIVLPSSPLPPVEITRCLTFGFQPPLETGFLEIQWRIPDGGPESYEEFEIRINDRFQGILAGPRSTITFGGLAAGDYQVEIIAYSEHHSSSASESVVCPVYPVSAPQAADCTVLDCEAERATLHIRYEISEGETYHGIAAWRLPDPDGPDAQVFLGYFNPAEREIRLQDQPLQVNRVEIAGVRRPLEDPRILQFSNVPRAPGEHAYALCIPREEDCLRRRPYFRRGDCDGDGFITIGDPVYILLFLFTGRVQPACLDALDIDDDGRHNLMDPLPAPSAAGRIRRRTGWKTARSPLARRNESLPAPRRFYSFSSS